MKRPALLPVTTALAALSFTAIAQESAPLQWLESGVKERKLGYRPRSVAVSAERPAELKKLPEGLDDAKFGVLQIGRTKYSAAVSYADRQPKRLLVDGNANGDLTDDAPADWHEVKSKRADGTESSTWLSDATVEIPFAGGVRKGHVNFYRMVIKDRELVSCYPDYALAGKVKVGEREVDALLLDSGMLGEFPAAPATITQTPMLWLDLDGNGVGGSGETTLTTRPFQADGKWWAVNGMTAEGSFKIVASEAPKVEKPTGPDLSPGQKAPVFSAVRTDGTPVKFPDDYKGKVVLIDFWATWCGPCISEAPNVVKAYAEYHPQGLEILGISFDKTGDEEKLKTVATKHSITWPQVFDGKGWEAAVGQLYGIRSIPHMLLVDGDTGLIVANKDIRGPKLAPAIARALADRKK